MHYSKLKFFPIIIFCFPASAFASCGSAFCNLNTDWDIQTERTQAGVRLDLRAEYIKQDELRHGSHKTKPSGEVDEHDELKTINRNYLATIDWNINQDWALTFRLPFLDRVHQHIHNEDNGAGGVNPEFEKWDFSGLGDIQTLGRYRFYHDATRNAGVRFGLKLPTGDIHKKNNTGAEAERSLQPGSGSVDTLIGVYYNVHHGNLSWFAQSLWQQAVHERDNYKPGKKLNADVGLNYKVSPDFNVMLQLNAQYKAHDQGANAEPAESGSTILSISPGLSYHVAGNTQLYGFVQLPVFQHMRGTQLSSDWSAAFGLSTRF